MPTLHFNRNVIRLAQSIPSEGKATHKKEIYAHMQRTVSTDLQTTLRSSAQPSRKQHVTYVVELAVADMFELVKRVEGHGGQRVNVQAKLWFRLVGRLLSGGNQRRNIQLSLDPLAVSHQEVVHAFQGRFSCHKTKCTRDLL